MTLDHSKPTGRIVGFSPELEGPLAGVRVLDLSRLVVGNMLSLQLGDFGADVIKVEPPDGDSLRHWVDAGKQLYWSNYCRNKRSIVLDLRQAKGKEILLDLARTADVLIENYRPGTLERMGLAPAVLHGVNDRLIVVRISGFGQTGPYSPQPGFGTLIEAMSGFAARTGFADRPPVLPPNPMADMVAGMQGAFATVTAVVARDQRKVRNQVIDLALLEPLFSTIGPDLAVYRQNGYVPGRYGSGSDGSAPRNVYPCNDGRFVALSASTQATAERVFDVIERPDLKTDPRYLTNVARVANRESLDQLLGAWFAQRTRSEALDAMHAGDVPVSGIYDVTDIAEDRHFIEREVFVEVEDSDGSFIPMQNVAPRFSESPGGLRRRAPTLGEHTDSVLGELHYDAAELADLRRAGTIR